jgi:hypothetical protein
VLQREEGRARFRTWRLAAALVGALLVAGVAGCATRSIPGAREAPATFIYLGTNPFAVAQSTPVGRRLHALEGWRNELYMGYGDYHENTGPVEISVYDPGPGTFSSKLRFPSEAVMVYRAIGERLYAPAIDPLGSGQSASVAIGEPDGRWWNNASVFVTHAFDVATLDGTDLWLVGSQGTRAVALRSTDGGLSWVTGLALPPRSGRRDDFARFYFAFAYGGRLVVQAEDAVGGSHPRSTLFTDAGWIDGPDLEPFGRAACKPLPFAGKIVYRGRAGLMAYDGASIERVGPDALDIAVDAGALYALADGEVRRTTDLSTWTIVAPPPTGARSIGVLHGWLYLGTSDSALYRLSRPLATVGPARP